ncbi:nuclear transport factor 2 family protein [Siccirubricoccus sp. KC 17139]|uniref:Nuclear transport factor 2 family protein n=1 Tax=Siccirubricoccus soli TaxID=2899147 RepID=A0ABT1D9B0_9PROT|nr:nuclear transport factor 2 family protein [Siccirubricoccus soli]MCO6418522.1 nuclear transport factor 2 family protein [Siccirubricoccus soli]MCP2684657.1 nuclear transport factor 2 family protein [Siccirubricoccus soli]
MCSSPADPTPVQRVTELYDRYAAGDRDCVLDALAEDVVWTSHGGELLPWSGRHEGRAGVEAYFRQLDAELKVTFYRCERIIAQGGWVAVQASVRTSFRGGPEQAFAKVDLLRLDGDRLAEFHEYYDSASLTRCVLEARAAPGG